MSKVLGFSEKFGWFMIVAAFIAWVPFLLNLYADHRDDREAQRVEAEYAAENFMVAHAVQVPDFTSDTAWEDVPIFVDRDIFRDFKGTYYVELRGFPDREMILPVATETLFYTTGASLPVGPALNLDWWSGQQWRGSALDPGQYIIRTTWVIRHDSDEVPDGRVSIYSNPFRVFSSDPIALQKELEDELDDLRQITKGADND